MATVMENRGELWFSNKTSFKSIIINVAATTVFIEIVWIIKQNNENQDLYKVLQKYFENKLVLQKKIVKEN